MMPLDLEMGEVKIETEEIQGLQGSEEESESESEEQAEETEAKESEEESDKDSEEVEDSETETEDSDEINVSIEGEESDEDETKAAPKWVKDLRKTNREQKKRIRELESKISQSQESKQIVLGEKPTIEDCDYDTDAYEKKLSDWYDKKAEFDKQELKAKVHREEEEKVWKKTIQAYEQKKKALKVPDYEDAEDYFSDIANQTQVGIVVQGAEDPALVMYALYKNPKKAEELCAIKDPVKFSFAIAKLETSLRVTQRKVKTQPEKVITGKQGVVSSSDKSLERLRKEAESTGDYTKVIAYKKKLKK